jgi:hypothetical protein
MIIEHQLSKEDQKTSQNVKSALMKHVKSIQSDQIKNWANYEGVYFTGMTGVQLEDIDEDDIGPDLVEEVTATRLWNLERNLPRPRLSFSKEDCSSTHRLQTLWDIDSLLVYFKSLSCIKTSLKINLKPDPRRNLRHSIHFKIQGKPAHSIPHFQFATFHSHGMEYAVYLLLPALYQKGRKRKYQNDILNAVSHKHIQEFVDKIWLPAIRDVLPKCDQTAWPPTWQVHSNKCKFPGHTGVPLLRATPEGQHQEIQYDLRDVHIGAVWDKCEQLLRRSSAQGELKALRGCVFLVSGKNFKALSTSEDFAGIMQFFERKVFPRNHNLMADESEFPIR